MGQTFYQIWIHIVWGTRDNQAVLNDDIRHKMFNHIKHKAVEEKTYLDTISGTADHIHCLISINPKYSVSEIVNKLKGESSHWINANQLTSSHFAWQNGYTAFSVSESQVKKVRTYILDQENIHKIFTYPEELKKLLKLHNVHTD